jgi:hypothetical protein
MPRALVVAVLSLSLSGCFLDFGQNYGTGIPGGNISGVVDLDVMNDPCDVLPEQKIECQFKFLSLVIKAQAQFAGIAQLQYWLDPVIVQVPVDTSNVSGTFSGPANGNISFTTVTGPLRADATGGCPAGTVPLYRVYNHGMGNAPNHRFVTTLAEKQLMVAKGYDDEGVRACVPA